MEIAHLTMAKIVNFMLHILSQKSKKKKKKQTKTSKEMERTINDQQQKDVAPTQGARQAVSQLKLEKQH